MRPPCSKLVNRWFSRGACSLSVDVERVASAARGRSHTLNVSRGVAHAAGFSFIAVFTCPIKSIVGQVWDKPPRVTPTCFLERIVRPNDRRIGCMGDLTEQVCPGPSKLRVTLQVGAKGLTEGDRTDLTCVVSSDLLHLLLLLVVRRESDGDLTRGNPAPGNSRQASKDSPLTPTSYKAKASLRITPINARFACSPSLVFFS